MKHASLKIYGKVQGVFYRVSAKKKADDLGLKGWVKNETDGTVVVRVQGAAKGLEKFIKWCYNGPSYARVEKVDLEYLPEEGRYSLFEILD